jgi:adenine deaminase
VYPVDFLVKKCISLGRYGEIMDIGGIGVTNLANIAQDLPIVIQGMIQDHNLKSISKDRQWLINQLKQQGYEREDIPFIQTALFSPDHRLEVTFPIYS